MRSIKNAVFVLVKPRLVFENIKEKEGLVWLIAIVLLAGMLLLKSVLAIPAVQKEAVKSAKQVQKQISAEAEKGGKGKDSTTPISEGASEQMAQGPPLGMVISGAVIQDVMMVIGLLISASILLLLVMILGGSINFSKSLSLMALSFMPFFARDLLQTLYTLITGRLASGMGLAALIMPKASVIMMNPSTKPPEMPSPYLIYTLSRVDLFVIWHLALLFFGLVILAGLSKRKSALLSVGYWFITLLPLIAGMFLGSLFLPRGPM